MDAQSMNARLDRLEQAIFARFDQISTEVAALDRKVTSLQEFVLEFRAETIQRFEHLENRVDMMLLTVQSFDARVPALTKAVMDMQVRMGKLEKPAA